MVAAVRDRRANEVCDRLLTDAGSPHGSAPVRALLQAAATQGPRRIPAIDATGYRDVIGHFASGVAIVTCQGTGGPAGLTTNAVTSLSLDPLLLLVCFDNSSRTLPVVREARRFAVNVLRAGQEDLAATFASKRVAEQKFDAVTHRVAHGVPVLDDALAWVACELTELIPGGDHTIGIGAVVAGGASEGEPLVFYRGAYRTR